MKERILIMEDETAIQSVLYELLTDAGYEVSLASDGLEGISLFQSQSFSLILLDIMMPKIDGYAVCELVRKESKIPIIMLTAKSEEYDELNGFKCGADDYVRKPFSPKILMARIEALLRYVDKFVETKEEGLVVDSSKHKVYLEGEELTLTPKEFILLNYMMKNRGLVLTREQILAAVWDFDYDGDMRTVDTHIKRVRKKLDGRFIKTIHGYGYKFQEEL